MGSCISLWIVSIDKTALLFRGGSNGILDCGAIYAGSPNATINGLGVWSKHLDRRKGKSRSSLWCGVCPLRHCRDLVSKME